MSAGFQLPASLANLPPDVLRKKYDELTPEERRMLGFTRPATDQEAAGVEAQQAPSGAPADFGGQVFSSPTTIQVSDDTDSGVAETRLPTGMQFQRGVATGQPQMDATNPVQAEVVPPMMRTVGAQFGASPETLTKQQSDAVVPMFDPSGQLRDIPYEHMKDALAAGAKPGVRIKAPNGDIRIVPPEMTAEAQKAGGQVLPIEDQAVQHAGFWSNLGSDLYQMGKGAVQQVPELMSPGKVAGEKLASEVQSIRQTGKTVEQNKYAERKAAGYGTGYALTAPVAEQLGANVEGMEQSAGEGDVAGVAGHAAAPLVATAAAEGLAKVAPAAIEAGSSAVAKVAEKAKNITPKQAAQVVGATGGGVAGHGTLSAPGAYYGAKTAGHLAESVLGKERANAPIRGTTSPTAPPPMPEVAPAAQTATAPAKPPRSAPVERDATLNKRNIPEFAGEEEAPSFETPKKAPETPQAQETAQPAWSPEKSPTGSLEGDLNQMLKRAQAEGKAGLDTAEGHKEAPRIPAARGPVPEGMTTGGNEDLTAILQKSLEQVQAKKGGVLTNAAPGDLAKRWGVTEKSLTEGREQTRGMSPQETEADIQKLTDLYKKGHAVEPVMETRDANNNIVSVDGRGRAIAAMRAGVEKIPVIVRRLAPAQ